MKAVLFTRVSPPKCYCANVLYERDILSAVALETPQRKQRAITYLNAVLGYAAHPMTAIRKTRNTFLHRRFFGNQEYHNRRILQHSYESIDSGLPAFSFADINDEECVSWICEYNPDLVFVFGTRLIRRTLLEAFQCPVVNMHWGWSPDYRAEGIVSALSAGGSKELGVTVHLLDISVDGGDVLYQERLRVDKQDNFYSIGLKLAKIGTKLFIRSYQDFVEDGSLAGIRQYLSQGKLYSSKYMRRHPELYYRAWKNLVGEESRL